MKIKAYFITAMAILAFAYVFFLAGLFLLPDYKLDRVAANDLRKTLEQGEKESAAEKARQYHMDYDIVDGTYVIYADSKTWTDYAKETAVGGMSLFFLLALLAIGGCLYFAEKRILKPFARLQEFAGHVAYGNLELPLPMDKGNIFGAFTESFDLMRDELAAARKREQAADESKKELVASLSHDIKTPLSSILATAELLSVKTQEKANREKLNVIRRKAEQIKVLIDNLFQATLEELEELKVEPVAAASTEIVKLLLESDYEHLLHRMDVKDCLVTCDLLRLQQVCDNLFSNSYKYAHTPIAVDSWISDGFLYLEISDEGVGVLPEERPLLKQRYYRGSNSTGIGGSGIGLFISEYFMEKMGGLLEIENQEKGFGVVLALKLL